MSARVPTTLMVTVATDATIGDSKEIPYGDSICGEFFLDSSQTMVTLTWYAASELGGTYYAAYDADGVAITQTVAASRAYPIPSDLAGARAIKAAGNVDGTITVCLKA